MKGLVLKDLLALKKNYLPTLVVLVVGLCIAAFTAQNMGPALFGMLVVVSGTGTLSTFSYDEAAGWDRYAVALPVSRRQIVKARYLVAAGATICTALLALGLGMATGLLLRTASPWASASATTGALTGLTFTSLAVGLPVAFRFGPNKAVAVTSLVYAAAVGAVLFLVLPLRGWVEALALSGPRVAGIFGGFGALCLAAFAASYLISVRCYARREF